MEAGIKDWVDILVISLYFVFVIAVGLLSMCRKNRESVTGYFLAGRSMTWVVIGASLFASNIGSEHFIGLAGSGAASGIGVVTFEWGAVVLLVLLGWVFLPIYLTANVFTIPEYLKHRFGGQRLRIYFSLLSLLLYVATKISVDVYAGAVFIQQALGWNLYLCMVPLLAVTALYTLAGGLAAVVFTDTLQTVIMLAGAIVLTCLAFTEVGGFSGLWYKYMEAVAFANVTDVIGGTDVINSTDGINFTDIMNSTDIIANSTCGLPRSDAFHVLRDPVHSDLPWPGVLFRATVASLWNWCADQVMVQRALAAKNMAHAKGATIMAGYLKFLPLFLIIMPGMISRVLYVDDVACRSRAHCLEVCGNPVGCSNVAYPLLVLRLAPIGMRGLLMAVMVAALMSSLTSVFNSAATVFTLDLWLRFKPASSEKQQLFVGRVFVLVLVVISVAWIPLITGSQNGQLFLYIQSVAGYIAPPVCAIFILAVSIPRINEKGAFWGTVLGQCVGLARLVLDFVYPDPGCGHPDTRPALVSQVHFTYFSAIVFFVTAIVAVIVSLATSPPTPEQVEGLTWWTVYKQRRRPASDEFHNNALTLSVPHAKDLELEITVSPSSDGSTDVQSHDVPNGISDVDPPLQDASVETSAADVNKTEKTSSSRVFSLDIASPWGMILDLNAILLLCVCVFLFAFFA